MATEIVIPALGESITEAVIASWLVSEGDYVERDQEIVELETDKVTMPLPSPAAGVIKFGAAEGDTVDVGATVGSIDENAEKPAGTTAPAPAAPAAEAPKQDPAPAPVPASSTPAAAASAAPAATAPGSSGSSAGATDAQATPLAKKLASERGIDLSGVVGTGASGKIREQDVLAAVQAAPMNGSAAPAAAASGARARETKRERMTPLRKTIANQLVKAQQTAAMLTTFNECDMTNVMALRSRQKDAFLETHGVKLGFMSFFTKAVCSALQKFPAVNSSIVEGEKGPEVESRSYCDVAIAVGTDKGLVVPVLRDADTLGFAGVESGILELAKKARDGKLTLDEMQGGTFTITNGGIYGSMLSTPILNPPQSGILGMHNIIKRPVEHPEKPGEIALRPMMYIALSYDHRIVDGQGAVGFLKHIKECIETPERMLLGV